MKPLSAPRPSLFHRIAGFCLRLGLWLVPSVAALAALLGFAAWVMGIPGSSSAEYYQAWLLGLIVLGAYLGAYGVYVIVVLIALIGKQRWLFYGATAIIWVCLFLALAIMQGVWTELFSE